MSFARSSSISPGGLVAGSMVMLVMVLGRRGCEIHANRGFAGITLVVGVVMDLRFVDLLSYQIMLVHKYTHEYAHEHAYWLQS